MNTQLEYWINETANPEKATTLIDAMELLIKTIGTELEGIWLGWYYRVGIDDDKALWDMLQQSVLDGTVESIEQFSISVSEEVGFLEQRTLTSVLTALYELDKTDFKNEARAILTKDITNDDKLAELVELVSETQAHEFLEVIEFVGEPVILRLSEHYKESAWMEDDASEEVLEVSPDEIISKYVATLDYEHPIIDHYRNRRPMGLKMSMYLGIYSNDVTQLDDPVKLAQLLFLCYLLTREDVAYASDSVERTIAMLAGDSATELAAYKQLKIEIGKLS